MNDYKLLIKKLASQSFDVFDQLEDKSLVRSAFIVENVKVRISSKTQKKFAILMISDGIEHRDLPIWAHMYREKIQLCSENKLLFGFFQIEKSEGMLRLRCRELFDLELINDDQIQDINRQFDLLKQNVQRENTKAKNSSKNKKQGKTETMLDMKISTNNLRFSQILQLKKTLQSHAGGTGVKITFTDHKGWVAGLSIDPSKGVEESHGLKEELKSLSFIQSFSFETERSIV